MEPSKELEKVIESKFLTPQKFAIEIEKIVVDQELNYIDAILHLLRVIIIKKFLLIGERK